MRPVNRAALAATLTFGFCTATSLSAAQAASHSAESGYLTGDHVDGVAMLPPPPAEGSDRQKTDDHAFSSTRELVGTPRWDLARSDANLAVPNVLHSFSCAAGFMIEADKAPKLVALLTEMGKTEAPEIKAAKNNWKRKRPFVNTSEPICTEEERNSIAKSGSYPSGHTTLGWSTALVLTEMLPQRATQIMQRGRVFGESRIVCGVHWESDVQEGYLNGAALVATMHGNPEFRADLEAARQELTALAASAPKPDEAGCQAEDDAAEHSPL